MSLGNKQLLFTHMVYDKGKPVIYTIEKKKTDKGIVKEMNVVVDPTYHFYSIKNEFKRESPNPYIKLDKVVRHETPYSKIHEAIAKTSKKRMEKYERLSEIGSNRELRRMHDDLNICGSDFHLEDYMINDWQKKNCDKIEDFPITKGFFDIEVDSSQYDGGFPDEELAPCPVNFISYLNSETMTLYGLCLLMANNPNQVEFFKKYRGNDKFEWNSATNEFCRKALEEHFQVESDKFDKVNSLQIKFFSNEIELIKTFFDLANKEKLDFMGAWNAVFDLKTLETRLIQANVDPADVMCPKNAPFKKVNIVKDKRTDDIRDRSHTFSITSNSIWCDMTFYYASIRKPEGMKDSYSLEYTLLNEIGESKFEYEGDIRDAVYQNYELFLLYSLFDSYRLYQLEKKTLDMDTMYQLSMLSGTRVNKVMTKTTMIRNFVQKRSELKGLTLSNNLNVFIEHEATPFEGAFVSDPLLNTNLNGINIGKTKVNNIFEDVIDEDFSSLYPNIAITGNIDSATLVGKVVIDDTNKDSELGRLISEGNPFIIGAEILDLPTLQELIDNKDKLV